MLQEEDRAKLRRSLLAHEHFRRHPYVDTVGKITIGIGYNLSDRGMEDDWINSQYEKDVSFFYGKLAEDFPWYLELSPDRQIILVDMAFMGYRRLLTFKKMFAALAEGDFKQAAVEMLDSRWALQTKGRATRLANAMLLGEYDI